MVNFANGYFGHELKTRAIGGNLKMNLNSNFLDNELFQGNLDIAIIISNNTYYYIFDDKENYTIDITPFYNLYLAKGVINEVQYEYALKNYRGGGR